MADQILNNLSNQVLTNYNNARTQAGTAQPAAPIGVGITPPISNAQQAAAFQMPAATSNAIANNINRIATPYTAPQLNTSPLAGLTTLGNVNQAGNTNINTGTSNQLTAAQLQQINALNAQAQGQGPSLAAIQAQQTGQQNIANEMALIASQRGSSSPALGLRSAQIANANANQQAIQAAVTGRTAEELNAQQQLTGALGTAQGQTMQGAQAQAQLTANTNAANVAAANAAALQQGSMNQQTTLANAAQAQQTGLANLGQIGATNALNAGQINAATQAQMTQANNALTAQENYANLVTGQNTQLQGIAAGVGIANTANQMGLVGAGIAGAAGLGAGVVSNPNLVSDRTLKSHIKNGTRSIKDFLSQMAPVKTSNSGFNLWSVA